MARGNKGMACDRKITANGVKKAVASRELDMALYKTVLFGLDNHCI